MTDEELARETLVAEHGVSPRGSMPGPYETSFVRAGMAEALRWVKSCGEIDTLSAHYYCVPVADLDARLAEIEGGSEDG